MNVEKKAMNEEEPRFFVCDDTCNYDINDIDLSTVPPHLYEEVLSLVKSAAQFDQVVTARRNS